MSPKQPRSAALSRVRTRASGLNALAMSMVLPHEHKPVRFPVVPAALTATIDLMADRTYAVGDSTTRRGFLCRDAGYPLWLDRFIFSMSVFMTDVSVLVSSAAETEIDLGTFYQDAIMGSGAAVDGNAATRAIACDLTPVASLNGRPAIYVPGGSKFVFQAKNYGTVPDGATLKLKFEYTLAAGEILTSVLVARKSGSDVLFAADVGSSTPATGLILEGSVPYGFVRLVSAHTGEVSPVGSGSVNGTFRYGWATGYHTDGPVGSFMALFPFSNPPEAKNSTIPYTKTRANATAALFSNVTAALNKEGTILAARLKSAVTPPWTFGDSDINLVHPKLRYYGPLEKGLYTFTTPSTDQETFQDKFIPCTVGDSSISMSQKITFDPDNLGTYNAFLFQDLGSAGVGTQLAVSCYSHLEFETVSSLFAPGVSTMTLETLHAAQVALLSFGHFHENPIHFGTIMKAATAALRTVAPMIAPIVQTVGTRALNAGVAYLKGQAAGDRGMRQATPGSDNRPRRAKPVRTRVKRRG